ncbi:U-scoloptoxin(19)-Sm1a isoform X2 [Plutella xylostella]|uniref:U-scoloptoxin(19)-Sm1a isoform X2 n=1 Tax=Plutella xylostella TaxID=51655 RepID=UPI0005D0C176|nr:U-scoloptoxin(19)-Sm1a isoform X2 [Plutella xylostella]
MRILLALTVSVLLFAAVHSNPKGRRSTTPHDMSIIELEEPCVRQGGICMRKEDCPKDYMVNVRAILCPQQHSLGVECCYNN